jgi:hypothetical protein
VVSAVVNGDGRLDDAAATVVGDLGQYTEVELRRGFDEAEGREWTLGLDSLPHAHISRWQESHAPRRPLPDRELYRSPWIQRSGGRSGSAHSSARSSASHFEMPAG